MKWINSNIWNMRRIIGISISDSRSYVALRLMFNWRLHCNFVLISTFFLFFMHQKWELIVNDESDVMCLNASTVKSKRTNLMCRNIFRNFIFRNLMNLFQMTQLNHSSQACFWFCICNCNWPNGWPDSGKYNVHFWMKLREITDVYSYSTIKLTVNVSVNWYCCLIDGLHFQ